ncbi:hypothetical protein A2V47_06640 [Candidatus Atribacteria bacterium RBG_19FT_COMBO_35_14]|uniref:TonB C-terminal domain-containing protein n=1 Tax=Candidatus Sediminicultor quintus TaxID=1797291 RepID=A0A1F5A9W6_9BACT|nr:MAG: hypothetical protein A2V47_06640 [Candidatus Atribacteria bacterium RBG_19FT_COMBO_35_14]
MNNKTFFIAIIISLLFHLWVMNIFSDISVRWDYQEEKGQTIISARVEFFASNSFSQPVEESINQYLKDDSVASEIISEEKEIVEQKKAQMENVKEGNVQKAEDNLSETTEISNKQEIFQNNELIEQDDEQIIQEEDDTQEADDYISHENKDEEPIQVAKKPEQREEKTQSSENYQKNSTLDLTQSDFEASQVIAPKIISFYPPKYPDNLRRREIEGQVQLRVLVDNEGNVIEALIDSPSSYQDFDQAAMESVFQWKFKPAQFDNKERDSWVLIPVVFKLE